MGANFNSHLIMKRSDLIEVIRALRDAGNEVIARWSSGDLATAVNNLEAAIETAADPAIEWWGKRRD